MSYLKEVLQSYAMEDAKTELLRHNENMTIKVGDAFLLRIHKHIEGFSAGYMYESLDQREIRREELKFLSYLHDNGMQVQTPIRNKNGEEVTVLSDGTLATMLTWLPGRDMKDEDISRESCFKVGEMVAKLHQTAKNYFPETVLRYDAGLCKSLKEKICIAWESNKSEEFSALRQEYFESTTEACALIGRRLKEKEKEFIPVHADLSLSNILITENGFLPIDFSLFGYGHPMMDLGALFCSRFSSLENRQAVAKGYTSAGGSIDFEMLDCCFALNVLLGIGLHVEKWIKEDWFPSRLERWCREMFVPLQEGKKLFSEDLYLLNVK